MHLYVYFNTPIGIIGSISYTTRSCKAMFLVPCLQCKLQCVLTNNSKDQSEWRMQQINHSGQGFMVINNPPPWAQVVYEP